MTRYLIVAEDPRFAQGDAVKLDAASPDAAAELYVALAGATAYPVTSITEISEDT